MAQCEFINCSGVMKPGIPAYDGIHLVFVGLIFRYIFVLTVHTYESQTSL